MNDTPTAAPEPLPLDEWERGFANPNNAELHDGVRKAGLAIIAALRASEADVRRLREENEHLERLVAHHVGIVLDAEDDRDAAAAEVRRLEQELVDSQETVSEEFEGSCTRAMQHLVKRLGGEDDVILHPDGWNADSAATFLMEVLSDGHRCADRAEANAARLRQRVGAIGRRAYTGSRTMDELMRDMMWIDDECRALLARDRDGKPANLARGLNDTKLAPPEPEPSDKAVKP